MLRIGMIGAGPVGQLAHLAQYAALPGVQVTALAELRPELRQQAGAQWGISALYPDHHALLANEDVDAVVVVVHRPVMAPIVRDALRAGKAVLAEKPMAHSVAQADLLLAEAQTPYAVGMMKRFDPGVLVARELLRLWQADGRHGDLVGVRGWCLGGPARADFAGFAMTNEPRPDGLEIWPTAPDWLAGDLIPAYETFLNVYSHDLNLLRWLMPSEPQVDRVVWRPDDEILLHFNCGSIPVEFECARRHLPVWTEGLEIRFQRATMRIDLATPLQPGAAARISVNGLPVTVPPGWAFQAQAAAFAAWLQGGPTPPTTAAETRGDLVLAEAIWRHACR